MFKLALFFFVLAIGLDLAFFLGFAYGIITFITVSQATAITMSLFYMFMIALITGLVKTRKS